VTPPPSPELQLAFLSKLQRLFAEGDFTATYKFALLIAIADLAVEMGSDDGEQLQLGNREIAEKFIELYWQQTAPYSAGQTGTVPGVLAQNNGTQAAIITALTDFRRKNPTVTVQAARRVEGFERMLRQVSQTVSAQPINFLQNLGCQTDRFLYDRIRGGIVLRTGIAFCLRRFQPLVQQLARSHWIGHIKRNRRNLAMLGQAHDLESFLFETSRENLAIICSGLRTLTNSRCFYCGAAAHNVDVDHFVPFSLYPRDLIHNFVLAHPSCNRSKSDTLAARPHLEHWLDYMGRNDDALREIAEQAGRISDPSSCRAVASWGYANAISSGAQAWLRPGVYEPVDSLYLSYLT
jgi:5-methylcytosine-specific restriction endonuclease McrA